MECIRFQGLKRKINISKEIGTNWETFGIFLLEDTTGERVDALTQKHGNDAEKITVAILAEWIAGRGRHPVSWKTLTEVLYDIGLHVLAGEIEAVEFQTTHSKTQSSELEYYSMIAFLYTVYVEISI